jgi:hypothetical protein
VTATDGRDLGGATSRPPRSRPGKRGDAIVRIAISEAAFEAIARTLPLGSVGYENKTNAKGERLIVMVGVGLGYIVTDAI